MHHALLLLALAATATEASVAEAPDSISLPEVSVTAVKAGGSLRAQPVASTVITGAEAARLGIESVKGASDVAPNFYVPDYGSRMTSSIYVRGLGARIDQPVVGLCVDNLPVMSKDNYDFDIADIAGIDIIRGPQSALYGRNTLAGQVNITTLSPLAWHGIRVTAEAGLYGRLRAGVGWYGSLGRAASPLHTAVTAAWGHSGGYWHNAYDGASSGRENNGALRWKTVWAPDASAWSAENTAALTLGRQDGYPYEQVATGQICYNDPTYYRRTSVSDVITLRLAPSSRFQATSITSLQWLDDDMTLDQDFMPLSYFTLTQRRRETALTQDFVLTGRSGRYSWLAGAFAMGRWQTMDAPVTFKDDGITALIEAKPNEYNPTYPISWCERELALQSHFRNPVWSAALYHRSTVALGPVTLEGSLRLEYEHNTLHYRSRCATAYDVLDLTDPASPGIYAHRTIDIDDASRLSSHFVQLIPRLAAAWTFGCGSLHASVAKGYKAGGYNTQMFSDVLQQRLMGELGITKLYDIAEIISYKPEHSWNYEVGGTLGFPSRRLTATWAAFWIECADQQLTVFPDGTTTGRIMTNAGRSRSLGLELQASWMPAPWAFTASYGYTDARFRHYNNGRADYSGNRVPYAPAHTLFIQASRTFALPGGWTLEPGLTLRATGPIAWDETSQLTQPLYALLGARATLAHGHWQIQLWGENLTSTRYATFYFVSIGNAFLQRGRPLTAGITLRLNIPQPSHLPQRQ